MFLRWKAATKLLLQDIVPRVGFMLDSHEFRPLCSRHLTQLLHTHGVNMRLLAPLLLEHTSEVR